MLLNPYMKNPHEKQKKTIIYFQLFETRRQIYSTKMPPIYFYLF
jgi:hypothetical protein